MSLTLDIQGKTGRWGTAVDSESEAIKYVISGQPWELARIYTDANELVGTLRVVDRRGKPRMEYYRGNQHKPAWSRPL